MKPDMKWHRGKVFFLILGLLVLFSGCPVLCADTGPLMITKDPKDVELSSVEYNTGSVFLECDADGYDPTLPVVWVKDDAIRLDNGPAPAGLKLTIDQSLANKLRNRMGDVESISNIHQMVLQGVYRCEVPGIDQHQNVSSSPAFVKFKDTMQFKGYLKSGADVSYNWVVSTARELGQDFTRNYPNGIRGRGVNTQCHTSGLEGGSTMCDFTITYVLPTEDYDSSLKQLFPHVKVLRGMTALGALDANLYGNLKNATEARTEHLRLLSQATFSLHSLKGCQTNAANEHVWNYTPLGETASSDVLCLKDGQLLPKETRQCLGNFSTGAVWGNIQQEEGCSKLPPSSSVTNDLERLNTVAINKKNVGRIASKLANLTSDPKVLTYTDIALSAEILHKLTLVARTRRKVGVSIVAVANNLMNTDKQNMAYAQRVNGSAEGIIQSLEKYALAANLRGKQTLRIQSDDIALEMWDLSKTDLNGGISGLGHREKEYEGIKKNKMELVHYNSTDDVVSLDTEAAIIMSDGVKQQIQELYDNFKGTKRLAFVVYRSPKLFLTPDQLQFPENYSPINSEIVALKLSSNDIQLRDHILTIFRVNENVMGTATCVHWDFDDSEAHWNWSSQGCSVETIEKGRVLCQCNHLANFAYYMKTAVPTRVTAKPVWHKVRFSQNTTLNSPELPNERTEISLNKSQMPQEIPQRTRPALSHKTTFGLITYCGLGLSSICLLLTVVSFVLFRKKLPWSHGHEILVNLTVALVGINVILIVGLELADNKYVCTAVAALLHYLLLVTFSLLLVEAVLQYYHFATDNFLKRFMLKTVLPSWVFPALLVVAILCTDYRVYWDTNHGCWLKNGSLYFTLVLPVGVITFINIVLYIWIIKDIVSDRLRKPSDQVLFEMTMMRILRRLSVFVLLGLTWAFGFLTMTRDNVVFGYVFCILNTFPGVLIFFFHVLKNKLVCYSWYTCMCPLMAKRKREARKAGRTSSKCAQDSTFEMKIRAHSSKDV